MLAKTVIAVSFAALAVAVPSGYVIMFISLHTCLTLFVTFNSSHQCETSKQNCCKTVSEASDPDTNKLLGLLGVIADVQALVGINCTPITVIGTGSGCAELVWLLLYLL